MEKLVFDALTARICLLLHAINKAFRSHKINLDLDLIHRFPGNFMVGFVGRKQPCELCEGDECVLSHKADYLEKVRIEIANWYGGGYIMIRATCGRCVPDWIPFEGHLHAMHLDNPLSAMFKIEHSLDDGYVVKCDENDIRAAFSEPRITQEQKLVLKKKPS